MDNALFWHFFPIMSPCGVFLLKAIVGMAKRPMITGPELVATAAWGLLSFAGWTVTISCGQRRLVISAGVLKGNSSHQEVERVVSLCYLVLITLVCGMTVAPNATLV